MATYKDLFEEQRQLNEVSLVSVEISISHNFSFHPFRDTKIAQTWNSIFILWFHIIFYQKKLW